MFPADTGNVLMGSKRFEADGILYVHYLLTFFDIRYYLLKHERPLDYITDRNSLTLYMWPRASKDM